jgi:hypothetical protein
MDDNDPPNNVVPLPGQRRDASNPAIVELLEAMLQRARAGHLRNLAVGFDEPGSRAAVVRVMTTNPTVEDVQALIAGLVGMQHFLAPQLGIKPL